VVRVLDLFEHQGTPVLVMEYVAGETLAELLRRRGRLPVAEALDLAREIARALAAAHAQGVIHRDLKPANIKLVEGQVKVLDFGLARLAAGDGLSASGGYLGTPEYSAPEQAEGRADERTDVYALGIVLYELLRGRPPFQGPTPLAVLRQHVENPVPPLPPEVPEDAQAVVRRCLAKEPSGRYHSAAELDEALAGLQRQVGASRSSSTSAAPATLDLGPPRA
jgi:serine/threonine-protein kinase